MRAYVGLLKPPEVKLHLTLVGRLEPPELQLDGDEPAKLAVVEQEVEVVVLAVDHDPLLAGDECEAGPELEEELLHLSQDGHLEVLLAVRVLQPEEIKEVRVAKDQVRREPAFIPQPGQLALGDLLGNLAREWSSSATTVFRALVDDAEALRRELRAGSPRVPLA